MGMTRHTSEQRAAIVERVKSGEISVENIAREQGVSDRTIHNWMRERKEGGGKFIEIPSAPPRATMVEISFPDGTLLRIRG
jgi:transposase-like protein